MSSGSELKRYFADISALLPCGYGEKRRYLRDLRSGVKVYLYENPSAVIEDVQARFGQPRQLAQAWLESEPSVEKYLRRKKKLRVAVSALLAVTVIAATIAAVLIDDYRKGIEITEGYVVETIIQGSEEADKHMKEITEEAIEVR